MATGIANATIPAMAREAGVSIPTVYRNFRTKADLFREIYPYSVRRSGATDLIEPTSLDDLGSSIRSILERTDAFDAVTRAAMASPAAEEVREASMERRISTTRRIADVIAPNLSDDDRERVARLLAVLGMSAALRMWRDNLSDSIDEAASDIAWVLRSVIAGAKSSTAQPRRRDP